MTGLAPTIGREDDLLRLRAAFQSATPPVMRVLTGMGGVGKTSLARAYTDRHRADYNLVWWIRAEDPNVIDAEFRALLDTVLPPGQAVQLTNARTAAFVYLAKQADPWLLILDNVLNPAAAHELLPPAGNGHILITSQATAWPDPATAIPVRPLDIESSVELLTTRSLNDDREAAEHLTTELAGLPLALAQAASFTRANAMALATYLRLYRSADLLHDGRPADYPHTVATTWQLAMDRLPDKAREMLNMIAYYAPDSIPVHLLFRSWGELARYRAIGELSAYSLVTRVAPDTISIHRLVQAVTRNLLNADLTAHEWVGKARELIFAVLPEYPMTAFSLATWNTLHTHIHSMLEHLPPEHADTLRLKHILANRTGEAGHAAAARSLFIDLLVIRENLLGVKHSDTLRTRHDLAFWTGQSGEAARAREMFAALLPIQRRVLGAEHSDTLATQHSLASWTEDAATSQRLLAELLPIRMSVLGADHFLTLATRRALAYRTGMLGDASRARELFADLIPLLERVWGPENPNTLAARYSLAHWTREAGDVVCAREILAGLLPIQERVLGVEHPDTGSTREDLARLSTSEE